ncbi:MAG: calcium-translocating P-type ATPase, PMCA-type [Bacteroidales bacterium]|nr:calcium-translocating P-type ATPase, PMCA-type [Bacteroidales bacterium]
MQKHYSGLTDAEVIESRRKHGVNVLTPSQKNTLWDTLKIVLKHWISISMALLTVTAIIVTAIMGGHYVMPVALAGAWLLITAVGFFGGFNDPLFKILITAFVLSMGIAIYEFEFHNAGCSTFFEPVGIIVALLLATGVAFFLERKNEKTFQSLNEVNDDTAVKVIRNNYVCMIPRRDVVVGDIVILETGEEVPADCKLLESLNLTVNESTLTGELQAYKTTDPAKFDKEATYPSDEVLKGTTIIEGYCTAEVIKVGDSTESGKVFKSAQVDEGDPTPLSEKLDELADKITKASYLVAALIIIGRIVTFFITNENDSFEWLDFVSYILNTVMIAVTLIVVAVPEGLPMSVTLSLAFSMKKLMKENTLPRTMHACETMGAASVICTDKTGTLTQNIMCVSDMVITDNSDTDLLAEMIATNSTANLDLSNPEMVKTLGNPTEGALLAWLHSQNKNYLDIRESTQTIDRLTFSTENKYMATIVKSNVLNKDVLYIKGAPEIVMGFSDINNADRESLNQKLTEFQNKAYRTLALAYLPLDHTNNIFADGKLNISNLRFAGVFAIADPVRKDVPMAIKSCTEAGIQVKIVTGDTSLTAKEIGRLSGLWTKNDSDDAIMTGTEFAAKSDDELLNRVADLKILSRAKPKDKERLVKLLKQKDYVVAATGDGTNDAPALNAADVGLSMGDGTAMAKESSDMTILNNSFGTITNAVMWGRSLYKNIQRFIMFQMTINVVACLIVLIGAFTGTQSPLTVTQMLWVNLIMDTFAAIALASLPPSKAVMKEKPRKVTDFIINKPMMKNIFGLGLFFTILLLGILIVMQHSDITSMADLIAFNFGSYNGLSAYELSLFFTIFVMLQFWNIFNAKAFMTGKTAFHDLPNCKGFMLITAVIFVGQIIIVEVGGRMFNVTHLNITDWITIILCTSPVLIIGELLRILKK